MKCAEQVISSGSRIIPAILVSVAEHIQERLDSIFVCDRRVERGHSDQCDMKIFSITRPMKQAWHKVCAGWLAI